MITRRRGVRVAGGLLVFAAWSCTAGQEAEPAAGAGGAGAVACTDPKGEVVVVYELDAAPAFVAQDDDELWFFGPGLTRAKKDGSGSSTLELTTDGVGLAGTSGRSVAGIALDASHVYWAHGGNLYRAPQEGGAVEAVYYPPGGSSGYAREVVLDDSYVYWVDSSCCGPMRAPVDGHTAANALITDSRTDPVYLAVNDTHVYWEGRGTLYRVGKDGSGVVEIYGGGGGIYGIDVDAEAVYWVEFGGRVMRAGLDGSEPRELSARGNGGEAGNLRQRGADLFVAMGSGVFRVAKDGSSTESWSSNGPSPAHDVAVDDQAVYWVSGNSSGSGAVARVCR